MSKTSTLIRNLGLIGVGRIAIQAVALVLLPVLTRSLNPTEYGVVELIITYVSLCAPLISLQLELAVFRFLISARGDTRETKNIISTAALPVAVLTIFWISLGAIVGYLIGNVLIWYFVANLTSMILFNVVIQVARGVGSNMLFAVGNIVVAGTTLLTVVLSVRLNHFNLDVYLLIIAAANTISFITVFVSLKLHRFLGVRSYEFYRLKSLLKYSLPLIPNALSWWVISAAGRTIAAIFLSVYYVGILAAASKFAAIVTGLSTVFSLAWMETASTTIDDKDRGAFFSTVVNQSLRFFSALTILVLGASPIMLHLLVDDRFSEAYYFVPILLVGALGHSMVSFYSGVLIAQNKTGKVANTSIASAVLSLVISLTLVHWIGLYAIVASTAFSFFFMVVYRQVTLQRELRFKYSISTLVLVAISLTLVLILYYQRAESVAILLISVVISLVLVTPAALSMLRSAAVRWRRKG